MSDDLLTTLRFEVDGSGVATGLTSVKRSITDLGNAVKDITDKTNAALGKVGTEELPVAKGLEKASKSIIKQTGDIEKAIATFGSTASTSLKQAYKDINAEEVRLRGMGIDAAIMNPYLEKLREVQKLTAAVAAQERTLAQGAAQAVEAENQRLAHTLEQGHAHVLFDGGHLAAQRGLGQAQFAGGGRERSGFCGLQKRLELVPVEVVHA